MRNVFVVLAAGLSAVSVAAQAEEPELPGWMAGCWEQRSGESWAEECWTAPRGGMMLGSGRVGTDDRVSSWESMRIALEPPAHGTSPRMAFAASPMGRGWTEFEWHPTEGEGVEFVNAANDYPQRVRYWRDGERLRARISALDGTRAAEWTFSRTGG